MGQVNLSTVIMNMASGGSNNTKVNNASSNAFSDSLTKAKNTSKANSTSKENSTNKNDNVNSKKETKETTNEATDTKKKSDLVVQPNKGNKVDNKKIDSKNIGSKKANETSDKKVEKNKDRQSQEKDTVSDDKSKILALVSEQLQIPIEEIQLLLQQMGLQPEDLLSQEGFSTFISGALAKGDMSQLLTEDFDMKQINELFNALTSLGENSDIQSSKEDSLLNLMSQVKTATEVYHEVKDEAHVLLKQEARDEMHAIIAEANVKEGNPRYDNNADVSAEQLVDGVQGGEHMGMTVPIHHFTSSSYAQTQNFDMGNGIMTQMNVAKHDGPSQFVLDQLDFKVIGQKRELSVQLSPKELGTMNIKIVENNGVFIAEIKVDNEQTKGFILNEIQTLKNNFEEQGLNVTEVKVDIRQNNSRQQMEQQKQKSSKRIQEIIGKQYGEEEVEEEITDVASDSEVDYKV